MAMNGDEVSMTAACPIDPKTCEFGVSRHDSFVTSSSITSDCYSKSNGEGLTQKRVFSSAFGSSVSMRFKSCENRFVTTPLSVAVKKLSGARISVRRASRCKLAPALCTETMKIAMPRRRSDIMAHIWSRANIPA